MGDVTFIVLIGLVVVAGIAKGARNSKLMVDETSPSSRRRQQIAFRFVVGFIAVAYVVAVVSYLRLA